MLFRHLFVIRRLSLIRSSQCLKSDFSNVSLCPIGQAQPAPETPYEPGQLVINRHFGYRGIILKSWHARLVDKNFALGNVELPRGCGNEDEQTKSESDLESEVNPPGPKRLIIGYALLLDVEDILKCNYLYSGISWIPDPNLRSGGILNERGVDYAFHDDLIPYASSSMVPIKSPLLTEFFLFIPDREPRFVPTVEMQTFFRLFRSALEMRTVYRQTTNGVRVTVVPFYLGLMGAEHYWRYAIRIENLTDELLTVRERFWKIFSMKGKIETISGKGVIGKEPVLMTNAPIFQYYSHTFTNRARTYMWGLFKIQKPSGATFDVKIPCCSLRYDDEKENHADKVPENDPDSTDK
ncbi:hypothetical protein Aperf_G00000090613 [Anoplocephala perfoliata]